MERILNIAVSHGGGLGDNLNTTAYCTAIKRRFPLSRIKVFVCRAPEIFEGNPIIDEVEKIDVNNFENLALSKLDQFDIFFDIRYAARVLFSSRALQLKEVRDYRDIHVKKFKRYEHLYKQFLNDIPAMDRLGKPFWELFYDSTGLSGSIEDTYIRLTPEHFEASKFYKGMRYVTVCNAAYGGLQTKSWSYKGWAAVTKYLRNIGFVPVQVGTKDDKDIPGAERFFGSVFESAALVKNAWFNISIEGGIAHIAKAVGVDSIVLFGPTPVKTFGYPNNINLRGGKCKPCWWQDKRWFDYCARERKTVGSDFTPPCMASLDPQQVIDSIHVMLKRKGLNMRKFVEPDFNMPEGTFQASVQAKIEAVLEKVKGTPQEYFEEEALKLKLDADNGYAHPWQQKRVHAILDMVGSGKRVLSVADGGYIGNLIKMQGNDVVVTDISEIRTIQCKYLLKLDAVQARAEKLPFPDASFDVVVAAEVLEHVPKMSVVMAELERVVKKNGKIVITIPIHPMHDAYEEHLHSIRTSNIEENMLVMGMQKIVPHYDRYLQEKRDQ